MGAYGLCIRDRCDGSFDVPTLREAFARVQVCSQCATHRSLSGWDVEAGFEHIEDRIAKLEEAVALLASQPRITQGPES